MALGRKTGGRQKGTGNKPRIIAATEEAIEAAQASAGLLPIDYMLLVMRDPMAAVRRRDDMAKSAAPYLHPRLATIDHRGNNGGGIHLEVKQFIIHLDGRAQTNGSALIEHEPIEDSSSNGRPREGGDRNGGGPAIKRYDE
jgi:hypothetical protein